MIEKVRGELKAINKEIWDLMECRKQKIAELQQMKNKDRTWCPVQELKVFWDYTQSHPDANEIEDLIFSLMIEGHSAPYDYPRWSKGEHLRVFTGKREEMLNPILLFYRNRSEYLSLKLTDEYQKELKLLEMNKEEK